MAARKRPRRRGKGEGSIEQLPSGKFRAVRPTIDGVRGDKATFETEAEAIAWKAAGVVGPRPTAVGTFADWLAVWLPLHKSAAAPQTYERDRQVIDTYVRPKWGAVKLRDIDSMAARAWFGELAAAGVSASESHRAGATFRKIVYAAVEEKVLSARPWVKLRLPSVERDEKRPFTAAQLAHLIWVAGGWSATAAAMVRVQVDACLRPGELLGLNVGDFDAATGRLAVQRSMCKRTRELRVLKTKQSRRTLPLTAATRAALAPLVAGRGPGEPLFLSVQGVHRYHYQNWQLNFVRPVFDAAGLEWATAYTPRHTGASLLISAGVNILVVSRRLGHKDPSMTLRVYSHLMPDDQEKATLAFERLMKAVPRKPTAPESPPGPSP